MYFYSATPTFKLVIIIRHGGDFKKKLGHKKSGLKADMFTALSVSRSLALGRATVAGEGEVIKQH